VRTKLEKDRRRVPPMPSPVLKRLYRSALRATLESKNGQRHPGLAAIEAAATMQLRARDVLVCATKSSTGSFDPCLGSNGGKAQLFPAASGTISDASAPAIYLARAVKLSQPRGAVLAMITERIQSTIERNLAIHLLEEAAKEKLPVVLVTTAAVGFSASQRKPGGVPRVSVDASDPIAVYRVCQESLRRAREGTGPTLVECVSARRDGLIFLENTLQQYGIWSEEWKQKLVREFRFNGVRVQHKPTRTRNGR